MQTNAHVLDLIMIVICRVVQTNKSKEKNWLTHIYIVSIHKQHFL